MNRSRLVSFISLLLIFAFLSSINGLSERKGDEKENKFRQRKASDDDAGYPNLDEDDLLNTQCPQHLELRWQTEVSSSIYATPLIADINSDGKLDIVVPSFVHYLEVLEGSDGEKMAGWPAFHQSTVHSSPLLYDIDKDGVRDIAMATYNGEVLFFGVSGYTMSDKLVVPRLKIRKDWYVGLLPDPVDRSHPDVHDDLIVQEAMTNSLPHTTGSESVSSTYNTNTTAQSNPTNGSETVSRILSSNMTAQPNLANGNETVSSTLSSNMTAQPNPANGSETVSSILGSNTIAQLNPANGSETVSSPLNSKLDDLINASLGENQVKNNDTQVEPTVQLSTNSENSTLDPGSVQTNNTENLTSSGRRLLQDVASKETEGGTHQAATVENDGGLEEEADSSFDLFREDDDDDPIDENNYDYDDDVDESMWGEEEWTEAEHEQIKNYVNVDSHILGTPVIADIDNDGVSEMVVAVSYFFDHEYYDNPEHAKELGGIDIGKYVAGSIVVFNLDTKQVKWVTELDQSTDTGKYRAYISSSPTVVDLDGDGNMDILVGTSYGMFYILDHMGKVREKFPLEMAELQGAVVAGDINDDGKIELVTADTHGNVAAWTAEGKEIWEVHVKSLVPSAPTIGDVDGDGHTDVVVPTLSGNIYVLSGIDGSVVRPYPYRTHGQVMNQLLLVDLSKRGEKKKGLTIVTTSFDGYLYLIDGPTSCADVVDIGETSYTMVLADNVDGGDDLDLIVTTMNGNVFCFSTPSQHHPLKAWRSYNQGRNNVANRFNREGIHILPSSRNYRDEEGKSFWIEIEIVDKYRFPSGSQGPYNVTTSLLVPGNFQGDRTIKQSQVYNNAGKHRIKLPTVLVRTTGTVLVEMFDKNGVHFSDEFSLTFHMYYYRLLKWILVLPMLGMFGVLVILRPQDTVPLPSFSRNTEL